MILYLLAKAAESDLRSIVSYTRKQWGDAQVRSYATRLEHGITRAAAGQGVFTDMSALYPALRMAHCEHHYVFCLPRENAPVLVVAIFHERMDMMKRLATRLNAKKLGR